MMQGLDVPTTWPSSPLANDLTSRREAKQVGGLTPMEMLYDRDRVVEQVGSTFHIGDDANISVSPWVTLGTISVRLHEGHTATRNQQVRALIRALPNGGATAHLRLVELISGELGTTPSRTDAGPLESAIVIPDDTWAGTVRTFELQGGTSSGGFALYSTIAMAGNLRFGDV